MKSGPFSRKSIRLYVFLQSATLVICWLWFAALWSVAFFNYTWEDFEWWLLVATACAGLYGLRPNLERAIDAAWLQGLKSSQAVAERIAQLRPVKRRIDLVFTAAVVTLMLAALIIYLVLLLSGNGSQA